VSTVPVEFEVCNRDDLYEFLAEQASVPIRTALETAGAGQRLRVISLPQQVMEQLCRDLQGDDRWTARVLISGTGTEPWHATATKIIELRNSLPQPLLVFIPSSLRTAAEDSLDIATFTELALPHVGKSSVPILMDKIPGACRKLIDDAFSFLRLKGIVRNEDQSVEYLLTVLKNGSTVNAAGGALFVFGLVPDFAVFSRANPAFWLSKNVNACAELSDTGKPLLERIVRLKLKPDTIQTELFTFLRTRHSDDTREWARDIALQTHYRHLSFDGWSFEDSTDDQELRLLLDPLSLPIQMEDNVAGAAQMPVLDLEGHQGLKVSFRSIPPHGEVSAWKTFRVQILSTEEGQPSVAWESNSFSKPGGRNRKITRTIKVADLQSLEEGTYFAKIEAYDESGAFLAKRHALNPDDDNSRAENESELFLVIRGETDIETPEPRAVYVRSLHDAWTAVATRNLASFDSPPDRSTLTGQWLEPVGAPLRGDVHFRMEGEELAGYTVTVPGLLRKIELATIQNPGQLGVLRVNLADVRSLSDVEVTRQTTQSLPDTQECRSFLETRAIVLEAIHTQHLKRSGKAEERSARAGIVETADLVDLEHEILAYAEAFVSLGRSLRRNEAHVRAYSVLSQVDVIEARWRKSARDPGRAVLLSPTHPLRLVWLLQHALMLHGAVDDHRAQVKKVPSWKRFFEQLRNELVPMNLPMVVFDQRSRGYVERGPLTNHWSLYLPDRGDSDSQVDAAACNDTVRRLLGVKGRPIEPSTVSGRDLAARIFEYLQQHPYVEQLRLNVFNPGDGQLIADMLREVEKQRLASSKAQPFPLRYSVQMFGASEHLHTMGESLESLLDPDRQVGEDDEFTLTSANHLLPKLVFARNGVKDFLQQPATFAAHVSVFVEQFATHTRLANTSSLYRGSYVRGLVQEPDMVVEGSGSQFGWHKGLRPFRPTDAGLAEDMICQCLEHVHAIEAAAAAGEVGSPGIAPVVSLQLDVRTQALLKEVHSQSDWVITVDRNMGIDFFDSATSTKESGYLLDYAPEYLQEDRQRLIITTRSTIELETLIHPALGCFGLHLERGDEVVVLEALRSLSGRLALRLLSSPTHSSEVVGLLLSRWLLEHAGLLSDQIVIPLDAHRSWFVSSSDSDVPNVNQRRADLLLARFDAKTRTICFTIVEVKLREELSDSARFYLYQQMREQSESTEKCLRQRFDPHLYPSERADYLLRTKELTTVLSFYIRRAQRYHLITDDEAANAIEFVQSIDSGFSLDFQSIGVLFQRTSSGTHVDEDEPGYTTYRFGHDVGERLLREATLGFVERLDPEESTKRLGEIVEPDGVKRIISDPQFDSFRSSLGSKKSLTKAIDVSVETPSATQLPPEEAKLPEGSRSTQSGEDDVSVHGSASSEDRLTDEAPERTQAPQYDAPSPSTDVTSPAFPVASGTHASRECDADEASVVTPDILVGATELTSQFGLIGRLSQAKVAIDLTGCNTISLFGVQGFGKSYTLGVIAEMAVKAVEGINRLPAPLATVIFHYHKSDAYAPEFVTAVDPNTNKREIEQLFTDYGARPSSLDDVMLLTPEAKLLERQQQFPRVDVRPIKFNSGELGAESWKFLLGAYGNDSFYIRQIVAIMRRHRHDLTLSTLEQDIQHAQLPPASQRLAQDRIELARPYIDDSCSLGDLLRPGRTIIVDLRDEWIEKDEALGLFVVMLRIFAKSRHQGNEFNKLVVFDEAHKYITESDLIGQVVETIREMRHQATSVVIASQDPLSVPRAVIELTSVLILHRITSPQWLKHLKSAISALDSTQDGHLTALRPGEALIWAQRSSDKRLTQRPQRMQIRPRFTQHGGRTKTAVDGDTIR